MVVLLLCITSKEERTIDSLTGGAYHQPMLATMPHTPSMATEPLYHSTPLLPGNVLSTSPLESEYVPCLRGVLMSKPP